MGFRYQALTHRQYLAWQAWLELEWNRPSRGDYYAMRVGVAVLESVGKKTELNDMRVKFAERAAGSQRIDAATKMKISQAGWKFAVGLRGE